MADNPCESEPTSTESDERRWLQALWDYALDVRGLAAITETDSGAAARWLETMVRDGVVVEDVGHPERYVVADEVGRRLCEEEATPSVDPGPPTDPPHVVVVGGGFAGLEVASRLRRAAAAGRLRLTLIDRHDHHLFQPLLYQVATAALAPQDVAVVLRSRLPTTGGVRVRRTAVTAVDVDRHAIVLDDGTELTWDHLVLAVGSETTDRGVAGVAEHAFSLKTLNDARALRNHLLRQFEQIELDGVADRAHVVVCGGGPTGVEMAGALVELTREVLARDFGVDCRDVRVTLLQAGDRLLPGFTPSTSRWVRRRLERRGVTVRTGVRVRQVRADGVELDDDETIATRTVVWSVGVRASGPRLLPGIPATPAGRLSVAADLSVEGHPDIHVIGDLAGPVGGVEHPQLATVAIQQGRHAAAEILRRLGDRPGRPFHYRPVGRWATVGRNAAVIELAGGRIRLRGRLAAWLWGLAHLLRLAGGRNRASVAVAWLWHHLTRDRSARLLVEDGAPRTATTRSEASVA